MMRLLLYPVNLVIDTLDGFGRYLDLMMRMFRSVFSWHKYLGLTVDHMFHMGVLSIPIVIITSLFSGMVIAVNAAYHLTTGLVPDMYVGGIVGVSVFIELSPMLTALVMTGKIGATIAAELGTMRVSDQIDALESLSFDPISYLIFPRILAAILIFPILIIFSDLFGILGGLFVAMYSMDVTYLEFIRGLRSDNK